MAIFSHVYWGYPAMYVARKKWTNQVSVGRRPKREKLEKTTERPRKNKVAFIKGSSCRRAR
jgi:hypothetical protein